MRKAPQYYFLLLKCASFFFLPLKIMKGYMIPACMTALNKSNDLFLFFLSFSGKMIWMNYRVYHFKAKPNTELFNLHHCDCTCDCDLGESLRSCSRKWLCQWILQQISARTYKWQSEISPRYEKCLHFAGRWISVSISISQHNELQGRDDRQMFTAVKHETCTLQCFSDGERGAADITFPASQSE